MSTQAEPDPAIEDGLNTILGILPDQDPTLIRRCLRHPNYSGGDGVERLMAALLEGTLPIELSLTDAERPVEGDVGEHGREEGVEEIIRGRANVLDAVQMDLSSLRIGKKQCVFFLFSHHHVYKTMLIT
jgi:activating signal cointegrator complex subunit 2